MRDVDEVESFLDPTIKRLMPDPHTLTDMEVASARIRYRLKPGKAVKDVSFDNLFYADIAKTSYADFAALKRAGKIPRDVKFQIDLVRAHSVI